MLHLVIMDSNEIAPNDKQPSELLPNLKDQQFSLTHQHQFQRSEEKLKNAGEKQVDDEDGDFFAFDELETAERENEAIQEIG